MQANPKISVIVPVYNVEKFLPRCLDSLLAQTFPDFEILLIDDGSKDRSGDICDKYALKDQRIRVFHKENGGVASARQLGVDEARGEYSIHADADDWIESNMLCDMVDKIGNADILVTDYYHNSKLGGQKYMRQKDCATSEELLEAIVKGEVFGSLWHKLLRRNLYQSIEFNTDLTFCEDQLLLFKILTSYKCKVINLHKAYYHYVYNDSSITQRTDREYFDNKIKYEDYALQVLSPMCFRHIRDIFVLDRLRSYSDPIQRKIYTNSEFKVILGRLPNAYTKRYGVYFLFVKHILLLIQFFKVPVCLKKILVRCFRFLKIL